MTICILLQAIASILMTPAAYPIDAQLAQLTGQWNLAPWLGHVAYILALAAFIFHLNMRISQWRVPSRTIASRIRCLLVVAIPVTLIVLWSSPVADAEGAILLGADNDDLLKYYWVVVGTVILYMLGYAAQLALILRCDIRSRKYADFYLVGIAMAAIVVVMQVFDAFDDYPCPFTCLLWPGIGVVQCLFCLLAALSWRAKQRHTVHR